MPGGVAGAQSAMTAPYADLKRLCRVYDAGIGLYQRQRVTGTTQVVVHALHQQGAAVACCAGAYFVGGHPQGAHDARVQRAVRVTRSQRAAEGEAKVGGRFIGNART